MSLLIILGLMLMLMFVGFQWQIEKLKVKRIENFFGKEFVQVISRGGDGILLQVIDESRDADFKFVPYYQKDDKFYYVMYPHEGGEDKKYHYKIAKKDTFTLRNRLRMAIVLKESMRALNVNHIATFHGLSDEVKKELLEDYTRYHSLKELYNRISKSLAMAQDPMEIQEKIEQMRQIREEMQKLKEKWKEGILQSYDKDKVLLIEDEDSDYVTIVRTVDLDEIDDTTTAVHPTEIYNTALRMFLDWYQEALREFGRMIVTTRMRMQQASAMKWILMIGGGLVGIFIVLRMLLGG